MFINNKSGYSLVELLIGILLMTIVSVFILTGLNQAKSSLYKMKVKEQAYEKLKNYTDYWKGKVAANEIPALTDDCDINQYCLDYDMDEQCAIKATTCYDIQTPPNNGSLAQLARISTEIQWEIFGNKDTLYFYVSQIIH